MKNLMLAITISLAFCATANAAQTTGELKKWHAVTLTFDGPKTSETADPNPFMDYRLDVTFTHAASGRAYVVPGFYAADGNAAITSANSGSKWRARFVPDETGKWTWSASFRQGKDVAVDDNPLAGKSCKPIDGQKGSFTIAATDKTGRDHRGKGRLQYVGEHYLRFAESGDYFMKAGADAPENLLAYEDFDATPNKGNRRKSWAPHAGDYNADAADLLWGPKNDKGKNLLGAVNYLSSEGMNAFSFLTFNVDGDDCNVIPHILKSDIATYEATTGKADKGKGWDLVHHTRFDVSKLAQWGRVFEYGDRKGMYLHFKTNETETDHKMDDGETGPERRAYYRELVARFGHHLALNWNLGEETKLTSAQIADCSNYIRAIDPYDHLIVLHTFPGAHDKVYRPLLGKSSVLTGLSIQTSKPTFPEVHDAIKKWVVESAAAGKKWVVACDEPGSASDGVVTDGEDPTHNNARRSALWGTLLAGGAGVEWYFGYKHPHSDLTCEDWRSRNLLWDQCRIALQFFRAYGIPFWEMAPRDELSETGNWVFAGEDDKGRDWLVAQVRDGKATITLPKADCSYGWLNPLTGKGLTGLLKPGTIKGGKQTFTAPGDGDWILLIVEGDLPSSDLAGVIEDKVPAKPKPTPRPFVYKFDPTKSKTVHEEKDGVVAVEAENFAKQTHDDVRKWYLTTPDLTPDVKPDGDENHSATASGGAYLEILPDTRWSHDQKLIQWENFTNFPGQMGVLYYPVYFNIPGRYYVWGRICCTGSEDNGLHVGIDGEWPESGQRMQWVGSHGKWQWHSKQRTAKVHTGERYKLFIDVKEPGLHTIMFSMREDGFEFDKWMMTTNRDLEIPTDMGPDERVKRP